MASASGVERFQSFTPEGSQVAAVLNRTGRAPICLVCEHASAFIPSWLNGLGLAEEERYSHAAWDIGAEALTVALSERLDAPAVVSRVSRLVYDCNRAPGAADAMPHESEGIAVPGNRTLSDADRTARIADVYEPFHVILGTTLDGFGKPPALVTVHSFTPVWYGRPRAVELGLLHDSDDRLARCMRAATEPTLRTEFNAPYTADDGVTHTLVRHALPRGLENVMIEVRNDLLSDKAGIARMADILAKTLTDALAARAVGA